MTDEISPFSHKATFSRIVEIARRRQSLIILVILVALVAALLHRALLPAYTLLPLDFIQTIAPWDHLDLGPLANPLVAGNGDDVCPLARATGRRLGGAGSDKRGELERLSPHAVLFAPMADTAGQRFVWGVRGNGSAAVCAAGEGQALRWCFNSGPLRYTGGWLWLH